MAGAELRLTIVIWIGSTVTVAAIVKEVRMHSKSASLLRQKIRRQKRGARKKMSSNILFPRASFISGAARTIDLWGHLDTYNYSRTEGEADALAIYSDWRVVGEQIFEAVITYGCNPQQLDLFPTRVEPIERKRVASE